MPKATRNDPSKSKSKNGSKASILTVGNIVPNSQRAVSLKRSLQPLSSLPVVNSTRPEVQELASSSTKKRKGKEREVSDLDDDGRISLQVSQHDEPEDHALWIDRFSPTTIDELAVHRNKVHEVRHWLEEAFDGGLNGTLRRYRRILALTGPAGAGKSTTVRLLSKEMQFELMEWRERANPYIEGIGEEWESHTGKFRTFLTRVSSYSPLLAGPVSRHRAILLEDLPTLSQQSSREAFYSSINLFLESPSAIGTPLIIIITDEGFRGNAEQSAGGFSKVDVRTVIPSSIISDLYTTEIKFNPVAPTLLSKALGLLVAKAHASSFPPRDKANKTMIDDIVDNANGDIRSAVMAIEFATRHNDGKTPTKADMHKKKRRRLRAEERLGLSMASQREQSLQLFHLLGKVLYNKRKGDPRPARLSAKELRKEQVEDDALGDLPPLPKWLGDQERRRSRVDAEMLYSDSPVDTSLYALYLHQNYPKFCETEEQCSEISDFLSASDVTGTSGEMNSWQPHINLHQFHLLTLGVLHSLPSPVPRNNQKMFKPAWFEANSKEKEARIALTETCNWLSATGVSFASGGRWSKAETACEAGRLLEYMADKTDQRPPLSHSLFSAIKFAASGCDDGGPIDEREDGYTDTALERNSSQSRSAGIASNDIEQGWLDDDDIEET